VFPLTLMVGQHYGHLACKETHSLNGQSLSSDIGGEGRLEGIDLTYIHLEKQLSTTTTTPI